MSLPQILEESHLMLIRYATIMLRAQKEITDYWEVHCDKEGYGPSNLIRHLEFGTSWYPCYLDEVCKDWGLDPEEIQAKLISPKELL